MPGRRYGPTDRNRTKHLLRALLAFADGDLENCDHLKIKCWWKNEDTARPELVVQTKRIELERLTAQCGNGLTDDQVRASLNHLKEFLGILEDNRPGNRGLHDWHFTLKLWTRDKEKNLAQFDEEWENCKAKRPSRVKKSPMQKATVEDASPLSAPCLSKIEHVPNLLTDWQQICRAMLDRQKKLSTNEIIASEAMQFDLLNDEIFVSLALVERKEPDRLNQNVHPAHSVERYEEKPAIEYEVFQEQVLKKGKDDRIAIIGKPGAGKTTLLQHIAFWILDQGLGLPIWISLGDLVKSGELQRLKDYLTQVWLEDAISNVTQDVESDFLEQLNKQRVWLLLDGVDEIVASSDIALREINKQLGSWPSQSCILLTCRLNVWDADINALRDFQTYRTKEFHYPTQVEQFIENGFCRSNPSSGQRLKTELAKPEQERLQQLVRNPLRLMMLCTTWQEQTGLPSTKAELYERFVSEFYKWNKTKWKKKDLNYALFPNTEAKQEKLNQALGRLACRALDEEPSPFRLPHNLVVEELGDPDEDGSNLWLALNLGWLQVARNSDKLSEKVYSFFHPTFQEYFAALAIEDWGFFLPNEHENKPVEGKKYRIFDPQWKETFLLWLNCHEKKLSREKKIQIVRELVNFYDGCGKWENIEGVNKGFYQFRACFLAFEFIYSISDGDQIPLANYVIAQVIDLSFGCYLDKNQQKYTYWEPIAQAARDVVQSSAAAKNVLQNSANEKILSVNEKILETVLEIIQSQQNRSILSQAFQVLRKIGIGQSSAISSLLEIVQDDEKDEYSQSSAVEALGEIARGHKGVIAVFLLLLDDSARDDYFRRLVAWNLSKVAQSEENLSSRHIAICKLKNLCSVQNEKIRQLSAVSLLEIENSNEIAVKTLEELCKSVNPSIKFESVIILIEYRINNIKIIKKTLEELCLESEEFTQLLSAKALKRIDPSNLIANEVIENLETNASKFLRRQINRTSGVDERNDPLIVSKLVNSIQQTRNGSDVLNLAEHLKSILHLSSQGKQKDIIQKLKIYVNDNAYKSNFLKFYACYYVLWHCAQNMSYPDFYRAWNSPFLNNSNYS